MILTVPLFLWFQDNVPKFATIEFVEFPFISSNCSCTEW